METNNEQPKPLDPQITQDLTNFFDNFLKPGETILTEEVVPGLSFTIKALTTSELLIAESVIQVDNPNIPYDIIQKIRGAAILSQAVIKLNDMVIERDDMTVEQNRARRIQFYHQLQKFPPAIIAKAYDLYLKAVKTQNKMYESSTVLKEKIENF